MTTETKEPLQPLQPLGQTAVSPAEAAPEEKPAEAAPAPAETMESVKAQLATISERYAQLERDHKSLKGTQASRARLDQALADLADEQRGMRAVLGVLTKGFASGDTSSVVTEADKIEQITASQRASRRAVETYNALRAKLDEVNTGADEKPVLDINTAPELEDFRTAWNKAAQAGDIAGVAEALADGTATIRRIERQRATRAEDAAKKAAREAKKQAREEQGDFHVALPGQGAPVGGKINVTRDQLAQMSPEEYAEKRDKILL